MVNVKKSFAVTTIYEMLCFVSTADLELELFHTKKGPLRPICGL